MWNKRKTEKRVQYTVCAVWVVSRIYSLTIKLLWINEKLWINKYKKNEIWIILWIFWNETNVYVDVVFTYNILCSFE